MQFFFATGFSIVTLIACLTLFPYLRRKILGSVQNPSKDLFVETVYWVVHLPFWGFSCGPAFNGMLVAVLSSVPWLSAFYFLLSLFLLIKLRPQRISTTTSPFSSQENKTPNRPILNSFPAPNYSLATSLRFIWILYFFSLFFSTFVVFAAIDPEAVPQEVSVSKALFLPEVVSYTISGIIIGTLSFFGYMAYSKKYQNPGHYETWLHFLVTVVGWSCSLSVSMLGIAVAMVTQNKFAFLPFACANAIIFFIQNPWSFEKKTSRLSTGQAIHPTRREY